MSFVERYGPWAVVAGASEGTGREFARQIAGKGLNCILIARREGPLSEVADQIRAESGVEVVTRRMMEIAKEWNLPRAIIVNKCEMPELDLETLVAQIQASFGQECLPVNLPTGGGKPSWNACSTTPAKPTSAT